VIAEALAEQGQQAIAMAGFFRAHLFKHFRGCGYDSRKASANAP